MNYSTGNCAVSIENTAYRPGPACGILFPGSSCPGPLFSAADHFREITIAAIPQTAISIG